MKPGDFIALLVVVLVLAVLSGCAQVKPMSGTCAVQLVAQQDGIMYLNYFCQPAED